MSDQQPEPTKPFILSTEEWKHVIDSSGLEASSLDQCRRIVARTEELLGRQGRSLDQWESAVDCGGEMDAPLVEKRRRILARIERYFGREEGFLEQTLLEPAERLPLEQPPSTKDFGQRDLSENLPNFLTRCGGLDDICVEQGSDSGNLEDLDLEQRGKRFRKPSLEECRNKTGEMKDLASDADRLKGLPPKHRLLDNLCLEYRRDTTGSRTDSPQLDNEEDGQQQSDSSELEDLSLELSQYETESSEDESFVLGSPPRAEESVYEKVSRLEAWASHQPTEDT